MNFIDRLATGESFVTSTEEIVSSLAEYETRYGPLALPECSVCGCCETPERCVWSVGCPRCGAEPREQCRRPSGVGVEGLHQERHERAREARCAATA